MAERAAKQLELNKSELPNSITEVIATLSRAGFDAYIVGGGVRDTLLGLAPKDFDAVTDAKPHEVKDVFGKRCRIIGRRFQLAHVYSGRDLIEVATFRAPPTSTANTTQDGMIIRDNVWGDIKQDFARRDFSINALYYQPLKGIVHDFCGALDDIRNQTIRLLGDAPVRIEEDPVRLLRALRFKAKLGFEFDDELAAQFTEDNWALLEQISPHRLYDETQKMFTGGYLVPLLPLLFESGAIDSLIIYPPAEPSALVQQVAINTDKRIAAGKSINPAFFYAALLWENYLHQLEKAKKRGMPFNDAQLQAAGKVIERQRIKTAIPKFAEQFIRDIWLLQPKLAAPRSRQIEQLSEHPRFRAGFDFLLLREQCGDADHPLSESTNGMGEWWQTYQTLTDAAQQQAIDDFDDSIRRGAHKRGRNRQKKRADQKTSSKITLEASDHKDGSSKRSTKSVVSDNTPVPEKRRRKADKADTLSNSASKDKAVASYQDQQELAQLQQLSLASETDNANKRKAAKPEPLLVIEHDPIVPPLRSSAAGDTAMTPKAAAKKSPKAKDKSEAQSDSQNHNEQTSSAKKSHSQTNRRQASPDQVTTSESKQPSVQKPTARDTATIAQTPQLVMTNNAPIPAKRRRKPSISEDADTNTKPTQQKKAPRYEKKAPKTLAEITQNKSAKADSSVDAHSTVNKGPVPAKRRRRKPSTDDSNA